MPEPIPRAALCRRILASRAAVVVLEGPAGMGKTVLLQALARDLGGLPVAVEARPDARPLLLWDVPIAGGVLPQG